MAGGFADYRLTTANADNDFVWNVLRLVPGNRQGADPDRQRASSAARRTRSARWRPSAPGTHHLHPKTVAGGGTVPGRNGLGQPWQPTRSRARIDEAAEAYVARLKTVVDACRTLRGEMNDLAHALPLWWAMTTACRCRAAPCYRRFYSQAQRGQVFDDDAAMGKAAQAAPKPWRGEARLCLRGDRRGGREGPPSRELARSGEIARRQANAAVQRGLRRQRPRPPCWSKRKKRVADFGAARAPADNWSAWVDPIKKIAASACFWEQNKTIQTTEKQASAAISFFRWHTPCSKPVRKPFSPSPGWALAFARHQGHPLRYCRWWTGPAIQCTPWKTPPLGIRHADLRHQPQQATPSRPFDTATSWRSELEANKQQELLSLVRSVQPNDIWMPTCANPRSLNLGRTVLCTSEGAGEPWNGAAGRRDLMVGKPGGTPVHSTRYLSLPPAGPLAASRTGKLPRDQVRYGMAAMLRVQRIIRKTTRASPLAHGCGRPLHPHAHHLTRSANQPRARAAITDAIARLMEHEAVYAFQYEGQALRLRQQEGFLKPPWSWRCSTRRWGRSGIPQGFGSLNTTHSSSAVGPLSKLADSAMRIYVLVAAPKHPANGHFIATQCNYIKNPRRRVARLFRRSSRPVWPCARAVHSGKRIKHS